MLFVHVSVKGFPDDSVLLSPVRVHITQSIEGPNRTKSGGREDLFPCCLLLELGFAPSAPLVLRSLDSGYVHTISFPGSSDGRWQIMELLSLHNSLSQFLIINLFLYIYILVCFSGELQLIHTELQRVRTSVICHQSWDRKMITQPEYKHAGGRAWRGGPMETGRK